MWNFPSGNFPSLSQPQRQAPRLFQPQRLALQPILATALSPPLQPAASQRAQPNLWEVAAWEIAHLGSCLMGNCHLGRRPWEKAFGKVPNTVSNYSYKYICSLYDHWSHIYHINGQMYIWENKSDFLYIKNTMN